MAMWNLTNFKALAAVLLAALATTSCMSFKHKTFPELSRYDDDEVAVVRLKSGMFSMAKVGLKGINGEAIKGMKGLEIIECSSRKSVTDCRNLLTVPRVGDMLMEVIDKGDTLRIYGRPIDNGYIKDMIITSQESASSLDVVVFHGKIMFDESLLEMR